MVTGQLEEMTNEQLQAIIIALQEILAPIQEKLTAIQKVLEGREKEEREWNRVLSHPESQRFLKNLTEETKADIATGRTRKWKTYRENFLHT